MLNKQTFPKSWELYKQYILSSIQGQSKEVISSLPIDDMITTSLSGAGVRNLYDFLDSKNIEMYVAKAVDWQVSINRMDIGVAYQTRVEAEKAGFSNALQILENKL